MIEGKLPPRILGMVMEWAAMHQDESYPFLAYTGFYDLFLEMFFGI